MRTKDGFATKNLKGSSDVYGECVEIYKRRGDAHREHHTLLLFPIQNQPKQYGADSKTKQEVLSSTTLTQLQILTWFLKA